MMTESPPDAAAAGATSKPALPQDVAVEIARAIDECGEYRAELDSREPQRLVDLRWAVLGASRKLGRRVEIVMTSAVHHGDAPITVRVVGEPARRPLVPPQRNVSP